MPPHVGVRIAPADDPSTAQTPPHACDLLGDMSASAHASSLSESSAKSVAHIRCWLELLVKMLHITSSAIPPLRRYPREEVLRIPFLGCSFM